MVLAVLDDLMFTSKIKAAAGHAGVPVTFARSADTALAEMKKAPPSLVLFDLDSTRIDPLAVVSAMKQEASLGAVPTLGFASHVHVDTLKAARNAGMDEVLTRGTFAAKVAEILSAHG